jgi:hypothetical protein
MRRNDNHGQMIILMGIILALSVFTISVLSADIINLESVIVSERSTSIRTEFNNVKETFIRSMNYNLANNVAINTIHSGDHDIDILIFQGNPRGIDENFTKTRDQIFTLQLRYHNIFDAELNKYWYAQKTNENSIYYVSATLSLDDGSAFISEDIIFTVLC